MKVVLYKYMYFIAYLIVFFQQKEEEEERLRKEEEERKQKAELEEFERKMHGRKRKHKKRQEEVVELSVWQKYRVYIVISVCVAVLIGVGAVYISQS